jgi:DNA replication protein DnaC
MFLRSYPVERAQELARPMRGPSLAFTGREQTYEIIRQRYERGSTIFTSNRAIEEWPPLFGDLLLASAALDRLLHHLT